MKAGIERARIEAMNAYPALRVDFQRFVETAALSDQHERPIKFQVVNSPESHTRLKFRLSWIAADGERHEVTSSAFTKLMWLAVVTDRLIFEGVYPEEKPADENQMALL